MKVTDRIKHECETIINIANLNKLKERDAAQLRHCINRLKELAYLYEIGYDELNKIREC